MILRRRNSLIFFGVICLGFYGCMKEEIPVPKYVPGDLQLNEIAMEQDYKNQLYFDLGTNTVVKSNLKTAWDIAFESAGNHIILNSAKGMKVAKSTLAYNEINSADDLDWYWDTSSGNLDSTAIGNWEENTHVYIIDRGYDWMGDEQGYAKLVVSERSANHFSIQCSDLMETTPTNYEVEMSTTEQFTYFSFDDGQVKIAPEDEEFDLIFTQYTHLFKDPPTPYLVTGVLSNKDRTSVARFDDSAFDAITRDDAMQLEYSYNVDAIGYNWKYYSLDEGLFTTFSNKHYVIRTAEGVYYKFRFTGFYNHEGLKGYPNIEFKEL